MANDAKREEEARTEIVESLALLLFVVGGTQMVSRVRHVSQGNGQRTCAISITRSINAMRFSLLLLESTSVEIQSARWSSHA